MKNKKKDEAWMDYLRERPELAAELMEEVQRREIADIEEKYADVIKAFNETKIATDNIVAELAALKESGIKQRSKKFQTAYKRAEEEWERIGCEFDKNIASRYNAYEQELLSCEAKCRELKSLLLI